METECDLQAEEVDGVSHSDPLRRFANSAARDPNFGHRGVLCEGVLKAGEAVTEIPEVGLLHPAIYASCYAGNTPTC